MFKRIIKKIKTGFKIIKNFGNWYTFFEDHFGLIKNKRIIFYLKNGTKFEVRAGSVDKGVINEVWIRQCYIPKQFGIEENDIVFDIGGHIGIFSVFAAKLAKNGKIFSFEPIPENFELLKKNIEINKIENVVPINKAVSDKNGEEIIYLSKDNTGGHSFFNSLNSKIKIKIPVISLNYFIEENKIPKIDFLKMDCEGAEYKILFSCSKENLEKIKKISMEYHNYNIDGHNAATLKEFLEKNKFKTIIKVFDHQLGMIYGYKIK